MAWTGGVLVVLLLGAGGTGAWLYRQLDGNIRAGDIDGKIGQDRPVNLSPGAKNILVVGSDSRAGANAEYGKDLDTMQSDTLMVLHIAANREWAAVVSLPRDSWIRIPACDRGDGSTSEPHHAKINEAFAIGGAQGDVGGAAACTIKTIEQNTGLRLDHFLSVDFQGFKGMVNALDGIEVCPEQAIRDKKARLDLEAGCQTIKDEQALGYVRTRYGVGDGSDIGRIGRQQEFMQALAAKAQDKLTSPGALYDVLDSATKSVSTDPSLAGIKPLTDLASTLQGIPKDRLTFLTVPHYPRELDVPTDKANISWQYPHAQNLFTALAKDQEVDKSRMTTPAPAPARGVRVQALNGTGTTGAAAEAAEHLRTAGYTVTATGNAPEPTATTTVTHPPGLEQQALAVAARLRTTVVPRVDANAAFDVVTLTIGRDYSGLRG
ncbi:LCP family protein [Streptomyces sp. CB03238]|uniref:LCP family protein n=1 Tax=Streptomyces sp. CB03238 TaxID=1907777 RepID=UPI000A0F9106|nr:LCP family protein [Streptomyces sp. CB03238]ORT59384.1 transcriptional regulator [Streptomyces sp. CB03238]